MNQPQHNRKELDKKVRRLFANRTHKLSGKNNRLDIEPGQEKYKTAIISYEPTVEKIVGLIMAECRAAMLDCEMELRVQFDAKKHDFTTFEFMVAHMNDFIGRLTGDAPR